MTLSDREYSSFFHTYKRLPLEIVRGDGAYLITADGSRYLDMVGGVAVNALGYGHQRLIDAIAQQAARYIHVSNYFLQEPQIVLAETLCKYSGFSRVFFTNSGTEAMEGALKIVRRWGSLNGKNTILAISNAFHGRTFGALSLMDRPKYRAGFEPLLSGFATVEFNNVPSLLAAATPTTAAIVLEFIQGEGGIRPISPEFAETLKSLQQQFGFLIVADEIQSGLGRTGKFFGFEHFSVKPDIAVVAKPLGGGLPLGAILGGDAVANILEPGMHGSTFGGNPVACAAGIVVLDEIMEKGILHNISAMGAHFLQRLTALQNEYPLLIKEVRGMGLMIGAELTREADPVVVAMRDKRILVNGTDQTVLRFIPPLIIGREHIDATISALKEVFASL
ncbi:MAG: acetylornithine transaminase [Ignavibacteriales bacterium]|nr:acetylornithine transaminase [Ignavibacteriales bacterium]